MTMKITMNDDRLLEGTPLEIVRAMQALAFGAQDLAVPAYIAWVAANALRFEDVALAITGETDAERAASLLDEMVRTGLARRG